MATPIAAVCWPLSSLAETVTSDHASAACYRRLKHVGVHAVVVAELKFRDVEWQIFGADFVERADNAALEDRPEALNRVRVNRADDVFVIRVADDLMAVTIDLAQPVVANPLVGNELVGWVERSDTYQGR